MLDLLRITIPFKPQAVMTSRPVATVFEAMQFKVSGQIRNMLKYTIDGMRVTAFSVAYDEDGNVSVSELKHPFESLPSSYSGIAIKIYDGFLGASAPVWPHVSLKASPAKLMQGHNIFGGSCILQAAIEFIMTLYTLYPTLYKDLEIREAQVTNIDATFSSRFLPIGSPIAHQTGRDLIKLLRNVSVGQLKPCQKRLHETTIYYNSPDAISGLKGYLKHDEVLQDLKDAKRKTDALSRRLVSILSNQDLQDFAQNLIRLEASFGKDYLRRHDIPLNLFDLIQYQRDLLKQGRCFLRELWLNKTAPLFKAFEGHTMKVLNDDDVLKKLMAVHGRPVKPRATKKMSEVEQILDEHGMYDHALGNQPQAVTISYSYANTLFSFYRDLKEHGYKSVYANYKSSNASLRKFQRYVADLVEAGLSKAYLQSFELNDEPTNIVPLIRFIEINFGEQFPEGYTPPVSRFANSPDLPSVFHRFVNQAA